MSKPLFRWMLLLALVVSSTAQAYDIDTHFYATYAMARYAGIKHEVAAQIATYAQWMDESEMTSPTEIFPAIFGIKKRRLFHFGATEKANGMTTYKIGSLDLKVFNQTFMANPVTGELMLEGLKDGDLMKAAASLHVLEDSFSHAGVGSAEGHAIEGHWPDRPYARDGSIEKYRLMVGATFKAMVAIRHLLPASARDMTLRDIADRTERAQICSAPNALLSAETLAENYLALPIVQQTVEHYMLTDERYTRFAVDFILRRGISLGYLERNVDPAVWMQTVQFENREVRPILVEIASRMKAEQDQTKKQIINIERIAKDVGMFTDPDYVLSLGGGDAVFEAAAEELIANQVPYPLSAVHRHEQEVEGPIREKEMALRIDDMRAMIKTLFGIHVRFEGLVKEAEAEMTHYADDVTITLSPERQKDWDHMAVSFVLPETMDAITGDWLTSDRKIWFDAVMHPFDYYNDITGARLKPQRENMFYRVPALLQKLEAQGIVHHLMSEQEFTKLEANKQAGQSSDNTGALYPVSCQSQWGNTVGVF